ncbi:MAG: magnesium transporter [Flavobacteriales bacterium]
MAVAGRTAAQLMIAAPVAVPPTTSLNELADVFERTGFFGLPVVDSGRLVGVVGRDAVQAALGDEAHLDHLKSQGIVGGEELRVMSLRTRAGRRLSWLSINIVLNVVAASVIAAFTDTLSQVIALAVFLPIISDMSGCSGNQAVAVSMRELSLGVAKPSDAFYVWTKEVTVGVVNGIALGLLLGVLAWLWQGNPWLGIVAGVALALNTIIAVSLGGVVPLLLTGIGVDPALASGPVLTTVTDLCGFLLVLGLATAMLPLLI